MPYTPPATSPVVSVSPGALQTHGGQHSQNQPPPNTDLLPPSLHLQNSSSTVFYLNGPGAVPRSASFLRKQPRSSPQKPYYYTQQNSRKFTDSTVADASAALNEPPASPSRSPDKQRLSHSNNPSSKPSAKHIESSDADDEDEDSSANGSSTTSSPTSTDDDEIEDNDEDAATIVAGRPSRRIKNLAALQEAMMHMPPQRRQVSPSRTTESDSALPVIMSSKSMLDLRVNSSAVDDTDLDGHPAPRMVRKKSGELVKPSLKSPRPSSVPSTPTYPKNVHFDTHLEHVRHFLQAERPAAVSNESSPADAKDDDFFPWLPRSLHRRNAGDEDDDSDSMPERSPSPSTLYDWELVLPNFPERPNENAVVFVERVFLSADQRSLLGHVAVKNLAFTKWVAAKFTVDYWKTVSEVGADFTDVLPGRLPRPPQGYDRFTFSIQLQDFSKLEHKTLFFCVRYNVNGQEYWDSNNSRNYQVEFKRKLKRSIQQPTREYQMYDRYERRSSDSAIEGSSSVGYPSTDSAIGSIPASFLSSTSLPPPPFAGSSSSSVFSRPAPVFTSTSQNKPPRPDPLDYSFDSYYTSQKATSSSPDPRGLTTFSEPSLSSKIKTSRPPTPVELVPPVGRPFTSRYDFRASLNAVFTSSSPSSNSTSSSSSFDTIVASTPHNRTTNGKRGFSFGAGRYNVINNVSNSNSPNVSPHDTGSPMSDMPAVMKNGIGRGSGPSSEDLRHVNDQLAGMGLDGSDSTPGRIVQEKPAIDSTSYQVFLDNYCFFQGPQRAATSSSSSLSPVHPTIVSSFAQSAPQSNVHPMTSARFYLGAVQSGSPSPSPSPENESSYEPPVMAISRESLPEPAASTPTAV
ncbi:putative phosphatase regulatory subunit-domain-containing protein [Lipomyces chichibuensis]|uniref:putative phosphatase regulatory subunit-domain-containing protein n=1 Tax=Lipomyces chichibuensis TaxID=1546026 RepID=UPI003343576C